VLGLAAALVAREAPAAVTADLTSGAPPERAPVALVRGTFTEKQDPTGEGPAASRSFAIVRRAMRRAGVPFDEITDEQVAEGALAGRALAVLGYSPLLAPLEREALTRFTASGGKVLVFYAIDRSLWKAVGIESARVRPRSRRGEFAEIRFRAGEVDFAPASVRQDSWNVLEVKPLPSARVLARWHDDGGTAGPPAVVEGTGGAAVTHIMLGPVGGPRARACLALAVRLGGAAVLESVARSRIERARAVPSWYGLSGVAELARSLDDPGTDRVGLLRALEEAARSEREAVSALELGAFAEAMRQGLLAERAAREAASLAFPARDGEVRAVWVRRPEDVDWALVAPRLGRAGFNTVLPNYVRGVTAAYESKTLASRTGAKSAGSLEACIRECRRAGLEVHVWWTVLFLDDTPEARVKELAEQGRLVRIAEGELMRPSPAAWLCPSHPANAALVKSAARELARAFGPDGIHLDYARLPLERSCLCERCRELFGLAESWPADVLPGGKRWEEFRRFRRARVTAMVKALVEAAREARAGTYASAAVFPELAMCRETLAQDWGEWIEKGLVDFVAPMDYTESVDELTRWVRDQSRRIRARVPLVAGIGVSAGRSRIDDPAELIRQIAAARSSGADGFALFQLDADLLEKHLAAMARGPGRTGASVRPHGGPVVRWSLPPGVDPAAIPAGRKIEIGLAVEGRTLAGLEVRAFAPVSARGRSSARPRVEMESALGRALGPLGRGPAAGKKSGLALVAPAGPFRIVVRGEVSTAGAGKRLVALRSPVFTGRTEADLAAERARREPKGTGPRVAVLEGGYGSRGMLVCLRRSDEFAAYPLRALPEAPFAGPRSPAVLVIPQQRDPGVLGGAAGKTVRSFVESGGAVLLTHDACGFRYHPALFPEVTPGGIGRERSSAVTPGAGGALARDVGAEPVAHAHYDHILLAVGGSGKVVARGETGAVVVAGLVGKGRVVACGVALGIDADELERAPTEREAEFLRALVRWLAQRGKKEDAR
jgi:uncharacterized lipoprotein YddW (UPF0748 family)